ncbi:MAG TPA: alcohol dehydrogenase catalytic domain-containing protein [Thermoanaerobaculia bacterium]|nr:alcohol dehydrogenase catalytic domain-containing protein [Thermoanaerobaculia bacterium]
MPDAKKATREQKGARPTMRAVVKTGPGPGPAYTEVREVPVPEPGPGWVRLKVLATAVCGTDKHIYGWDPSIQGSVKPPRIYGHEFCGIVDAFGPKVERSDLSLGQYVSCEMHVVCGNCRPCRTGNGHVCVNTRILGLHGDGCFAQYVVVPASNIVPLDAAVAPPKIGAFLDALGNAVHTTQVVDLSGKSVAILGYGPIGAMCASIAEVSGAAHLFITDVTPQAVKNAETWARKRKLKTVTVFDLSKTAPDEVVRRVGAACDGGVDVVLEIAGAEASVNLGLRLVRYGGFLSLLGLPRGKDITIHDYTKNVIFKGVTLQGIIGRRMYSTWYKMLDLLRAGLDVEYLVSKEYDSLEPFHEAMALLETRRAMKIVFYPNGKAEAAKV